MGERAKQRKLINQVVRINKVLLRAANNKAFWGEIFPSGISLVAVLGFTASISLSKYLLKAIAAERAKTIQRRTSTKSLRVNPCPL